ncbi:putative Polycomb group protein ASXL3 [Lineus longissimus]|uniref:putative Polycomb group protein ASXL3 n=1 Tax=Lineus longissimus TaxID=88925 RepID=UPI002B4D36EA
MNMENNIEKSTTRNKCRKWAEKAKTVLEQNCGKALDHNEILLTIQHDEEIGDTIPLEFLDALLHINSKGADCAFYKVLGRRGAYGLMSSVPEGGIISEMEDDCNVDTTIDAEEELVDLQDRPARDRKNEKVVFVKLTDDVPQSSAADLPQEEVKAPCLETIPQLPASSIAQNKPSRTSKRSRKHCIWQQKRRKKTKVVPKITIKPLPPPKESKQDPSYSMMTSVNVPETRQRPCLRTSTMSCSQKPTLKELLSSIPGFSWKPRKRTHKKLSTAAQIAQTKEGCIDLETPDSILVNTNLRALLNKHNFVELPVSYQYSLIQLLPDCDKIVSADASLRLSPSALNNEFFTKACNEWKQRLADGEFTPENQIRIKQEEEKEHARLDPWKVKHFEPVWGQKTLTVDPVPVPRSPVLSSMLPSTPPKTTSQIYSPQRNLVSTLIKQKTLAQNVASSISQSSSTISSKSETQTSGLSNIASSNSLANPIKTEPRPVMKNTLLLESLKRPMDLNTDSYIPSKRLKSAPQKFVQKVQGQVKFHRAKTLAQIKAQTAERKAQTAAAQARTGQTRTLAQIKAQTKAKLLARASAGSGEDKQRHLPNIIQPNRNKTEINLQRSYQICQAVIEKSISSGNMVSILNKTTPTSDSGGMAAPAGVQTEGVAKTSVATVTSCSPPSPFVQPASPSSIIQIRSLTSPPSPAVSPRSHVPISQQIQVVRTVPSPVTSVPSRPPSVTALSAAPSLSQSVNLQAIQTSRPTILRIRSPSATSLVASSVPGTIVSKTAPVSQMAVVKTVYVTQGGTTTAKSQVISTTPTSAASPVVQIKSVAPSSPARPQPTTSPVMIARPAPPSSPAGRPTQPSSPLARPAPTISPAMLRQIPTAQMILVPASSIKTSTSQTVGNSPMVNVSSAVAQSIQSQLANAGLLPSTSKLVLVTTSPSSNSNLCALLQPAKQTTASTSASENLSNLIKTINTCNINTNKNINTVKPSHFLSCTILKNNNPKSRTMISPPPGVGPPRSSSVPPQTNGVGPPRAASAPPPVDDQKSDSLLRSVSLNGSAFPLPGMNKENDKVALAGPSTIKAELATSLGVTASQLIKMASKPSMQLPPSIQTVQIPATATLKLRQDGTGYQVVKANPLSLASGIGVKPHLVQSASIMGAVTIPTSTDSSNGNCPCSLRAMVMCKKCGAFCHDDCIGPYILCANCVSAT